MKGPSFISTPNDVNWLSVRKELAGFISQLRYFANHGFQKGQEVKVIEMAPYQEQERADPKIPGDPAQNKEKQNWYNAKSKPTSSKNLELFIENLEKGLIN